MPMAKGKRVSSKIDAPVSFPIDSLDMRPFMADPSGPPELYDLFAVIVHLGNLDSGHYVAFVRKFSASEDCWFRTDDPMVTFASVKDVLSSQGYMLFYVRRSIR